jgi:HK97 family phage portal protein
VTIAKRFRMAWQILTGKSYHDANLEALCDFLGISSRLTGDALKEATYFACMKVLSESIGKVPIKIMQHTPRTGTLARREHRYYRVLNERPNPYMTATTFWAMSELFRNHYGNSYAYIDDRDPLHPKLYPMHPKDVTVYYDDARRLADVPDVYYRYTGGTKQFVFSSAEVLHFKNFLTRDGIMGIPTREQIADTVQGGINAQKMLNRLYQSGMTAKAVLQYTGGLNDANVDALKEGIQNYAAGKDSSGTGGIIPIPIGFTLTPLNIKLTDSQFLELKQYSALQIAAAFGIKPDQIGDYTKSSYSSSEAQQISFLVDTMLFIIKQYEEEISEKILTPEEREDGYTAKFATRVLMRVDQFTQIQTISTAVQSFLYKVNEGREFLDLPAVEGGDQLIGNGSTIPLSMVGIQYTKEGTNNGGRENSRSDL